MTGDTPYLLDTATARALLKADAPAELRQRIRTIRYGSVWISAITEGQLHRHVRLNPGDRVLSEALGLLLRNVPTVPFDRSAALAYASLQHGSDNQTGITDAEWMVAGHALSMEATLVTAEPALRRVANLRSENWLVA